jgi:TolA-binding protein
MKREEEPTDVLCQARRRPLSRDEQTRLEELVGQSPEARLLHSAGLSFDRDSSAQQDDDVLIARIAAVAERSATPGVRPARRRRRPLFTLLVAALAIAGTAGAGAGVVYLVRAPEAATRTVSQNLAPPSDVQPVAAKPVLRHATPAISSAPAELAEQAASEAEGAPPPGVGPATPTPAGKHGDRTTPLPVVGASALFEQANRKRLEGDTAGAVMLYRSLTQRHPGSAEAHLAQLSLGKLLLSSNSAGAALEHFRHAAASGGALAAEGIWGEANALRALGRTSEERAVLERLLVLHPNGAYASAARKRLGHPTP